MITISDFFCGAGGSSTGAVQVPGVTVRMAANHWSLAVETHQTNHPDADHDTADLSQVRADRYPTTDIAWLSPECTNHSLAKGQKRQSQQGLFGDDEAADRSRATMWDVIRFAEFHKYRAIIVENVVDARQWELWPAWSMALTSLGYEYRLVSLNSMHATALGPGAPQSRDRLYVVAWRKGDRAPDLNKWVRPYAQCPEHGTVQAVQAWRDPEKRVGKYRQQYTWRCPRVECRNAEVTPAVRPAADAIDWTLPAARIGDRPKPLAPKTMKRIEDGLATYGRPVMVPMEGREGKVAAPMSQPMRTCTTRNENAVAIPAGAFITELRGGGSKHRPVSDPLATVCAGGNHHGLTIPSMVAPYYGKARPRPAGEPLPTVTTVERHAVIPSGVVAGVEDVRFRMLTSAEYQAAMAFPSEYVILGGSSRVRVRMLGNAVTPPAARDLVAAVVEALTGETIDRAEPEIAAAA